MSSVGPALTIQLVWKCDKSLHRESRASAIVEFCTTSSSSCLRDRRVVFWFLWKTLRNHKKKIIIRIHGFGFTPFPHQLDSRRWGWNAPPGTRGSHSLARAAPGRLNSSGSNHEEGTRKFEHPHFEATVYLFVYYRSSNGDFFSYFFHDWPPPNRPELAPANSSWILKHLQSSYLIRHARLRLKIIPLSIISVEMQITHRSR